MAESADVALARARRHWAVVLFGPFLASAQATTVVAQTRPDTIPFLGGVTLHWKLDEMTDQKRCSVFTPARGMYVGIYGHDTVSFWIPEKAPLASGQRPTLVRIDSNAPINLVVTDKPRLIAVPKGHASQVVEALYRRSKIVVRYYTFPEQDERNVPISIGDVASAYDYAVKSCGWKSLGLDRMPLPKDPYIYKGENGSVSATFGGDGGWNVMFLPEYQSCRVSAGHVHAIFSSRNGQHDRILPLGLITFYRPKGAIVAKVSHDSFSPGPIAQFVRAAREAGEYGWVDMKNAKPASLYGLAEALRYTEQTCGVVLR